MLPTISLCMFTVASIAHYARSEMVEVLTSDYIQLADAKGISRTRLITRHAPATHSSASLLCWRRLW